MRSGRNCTAWKHWRRDPDARRRRTRDRRYQGHHPGLDRTGRLPGRSRSAPRATPPAHRRPARGQRLRPRGRRRPRAHRQRLGARAGPRRPRRGAGHPRRRAWRRPARSWSPTCTGTTTRWGSSCAGRSAARCPWASASKRPSRRCWRAACRAVRAATGRAAGQRGGTVLMLPGSGHRPALPGGAADWEAAGRVADLAPGDRRGLTAPCRGAHPGPHPGPRGVPRRRRRAAVRRRPRAAAHHPVDRVRAGAVPAPAAATTWSRCGWSGSLPDMRLLPAHGPVAPQRPRPRRRAARPPRRPARPLRRPRCGRGGHRATRPPASLRWTRRDRQLDELDPFNQMLAVIETRAHLELLAAQGRLASSTRDGVVVLRGTQPGCGVRAQLTRW